MFRIITRIPERTERRIPYNIQYNDNRLYRSISKNIRKSNTSRTKLNEYNKDKHLKKYILFTDNSLETLERNTGSISFVAYDTKMNTFLNGYLLVNHDSKIDSFYGGTSKSITNSKNWKDFNKVDRDCIPSLGDAQKNIKKGRERISSTAYNDVKGSTTRLFYGSLSQTGKVDKNPKPKNQRNFKKPFRHYIPSIGEVRKTFKKVATNSLSITGNIKKNIPFIFFGNMLKPGRKIKQGNDEKEFKESDKETVLNDTDSNIRNAQSFGDTGEIPEEIGNGPSEYFSDLIKNIGNILQQISGNISNEEKYEYLLKWRDEINNIYIKIKDLNTATSNIVFSQCSAYSESLKNLITSISQDEDYAELLPVLTCITVVSVQLLLLSYFNMPFADQMVNLALSLYHKAYLLKDDPNFQEVIAGTMKKIEEYMPISLDTLKSVDWVWYFYLTRKTFFIFKLVTKSWKESRMEFPDDELNN